VRGEIKAMKLESKLDGSKKGCDLTDLVRANSEHCVHQTKVSLKCHHVEEAPVAWNGERAQPERIFEHSRQSVRNNKNLNCKKTSKSGKIVEIRNSEFNSMEKWLGR
jgi:hypothetical protein